MWEIADELEMSDYVCSFNSLPWQQLHLEQSTLQTYAPRAVTSMSILT